MIRRSNLRPLTRNRKFEEMTPQHDVDLYDLEAIKEEFIIFLSGLIRRAENLRTYTADLDWLRTFSDYSNTLFKSKKVRNFIKQNDGYVIDHYSYPEMGIEIDVTDFAVKQTYQEISDDEYDIISNLKFAPYRLRIQEDGLVFLIISFVTGLNIDEW